MRGGVFGFLCSALLLAQDAVAQRSVPVGDKTAAKWVMRRVGASDYACKCYPGDDCWPGEDQWQKLNDTVDGNLLVNIPPGAPCYNTFEGLLGDVQTYDEAECQKVTQNWGDEQFQ